jgi:hypothetical protein
MASSPSRLAIVALGVASLVIVASDAHALTPADGASSSTEDVRLVVAEGGGRFRFEERHADGSPIGAGFDVPAARITVASSRIDHDRWLFHGLLLATLPAVVAATAAGLRVRRVPFPLLLGLGLSPFLIGAYAAHRAYANALVDLGLDAWLLPIAEMRDLARADIVRPLRVGGAASLLALVLGGIAHLGLRAGAVGGVGALLVATAVAVASVVVPPRVLPGAAFDVTRPTVRLATIPWSEARAFVDVPVIVVTQSGDSSLLEPRTGAPYSGAEALPGLDAQGRPPFLVLAADAGASYSRVAAALQPLADRGYRDVRWLLRNGATLATADLGGVLLPADAMPEHEPIGLRARVVLSPAGVTIFGRTHVIASDCEGVGAGPTVPRSNGGIDWPSVERCLVALKRAEPGFERETDVRLVPSSDSTMEEVAGAVGAARAVFSRVLLAPADEPDEPRHQWRRPGAKQLPITASPPMLRPAERVVASVRQRARGCYRVDTLRDPDAEGRVTYSLVLGSDGTVASAKVTVSGSLSMTMMRCVQKELETATFPPALFVSPVTGAFSFIAVSKGK